LGELAARLHHPFLRDALGHLLQPQIPASVLLGLWGQLAAGQLSRVQGGSQRLSDAVALRLEALGGVVRYGCDVEKILVEDDQAVGVRLTDGSEHRGDRVISTAPGYATVFRMLEGRYLDGKLRRIYTGWPTFPPLALVSFGVARRWPELPALLHAHLPAPWAVVGHPVERLRICNFSDDTLLAPAGHTISRAIAPSRARPSLRDRPHPPRYPPCARAPRSPLPPTRTSPWRTRL
jgi:phytoene dehydrogenase-like protein